MMIRTFSELQKIESFEDRYAYLSLRGIIGKSTFGFDRYLNQMLYTSNRWLKTRDSVIVRDSGCDLGIREYPILGYVTVHHMNPISIDDIENENNEIFNPEGLICVSHRTHLAIHYGDKNLLPKLPVTRQRNDTCPWLLQK